MEIPADFPDEYKKIGSKRSKFLDLGLPVPKPKVVIVKEYDSTEKGPLIKQKTPEPDYTGHTVRIVVHSPWSTPGEKLSLNSWLSELIS